MIDWKSFVAPAVKWALGIVLTILATKWADSRAVVTRLMAGDTVPLYDGAINLNLHQIQLWIAAGIITLVGAVSGWMQRTKAKREVNTALRLPVGATKADVKQVSEMSPVLSAEPDATALGEQKRSLQRAGIQ